MKDVFKEKYLEYEPKITLEIFTLVWNRLIELGYKSFARATIEERYGEFKGFCNYFRTTRDHPNEFNCYNNGLPYTKTTVEEILGYNPFIKETKPSKDWSKATEEELLEEAKRRYPIGCKVKLIGLNVGGDFGNEVRFTKHSFYRSGERKELYIDGNLVLFNGTVWAEIESLPKVEVKNETKEVIPEYIECIKPQSCYFIPGIVYKVLDTKYKSSCKIISNIKCSHYEANDSLFVSLTDSSYFKPSTKEAYDKQVSKEAYDKQVSKEPTRLSFYVKYCDEFTEDLLKSLIEWSQKNTTLKDRGRDNSFKGLKEDGYFLFDNFGFNSSKSCLYKDRSTYGYGVDNNIQGCFQEYSIKEVKELIGYKEQKPIEKWTVGGYVVAINNGNANGKPIDKYQIGFINKITHSFSDGTCGLEFSTNCCNKSDFKWFATKSEAEEFAKTLVEPAKKVKQAVHCKTQEEWDFFILKEVSKSHPMSKEPFQKDSAITFNNSWDKVEYLKMNDYQILSFQEWCDLNGYKMEKEVKFEVGEWYKVVYKNPKEEYYLKYINNRHEFGYSEYISISDNEHSLYHSGNDLDAMSVPIKVSIEEIQQYLPEGHPDKISSVKDTSILNESSIGKFISFKRGDRFYNKALIIIENGHIYLLNNCHSNNNGHKDKSIYKYSLKYRNFKEVETFCKEIKFLTMEESPKLDQQDLTPGYLDWEVVPKRITKSNEIEFTYLPEPN